MPVNETIERVIFEGVDRITAASKSAQASTKALKDTIDGVKDVLGALGVTIGAGAFIKLELDALHATAALDDMAEATGASVEKLSAIQRVAKVGGQDFDGLTQQIGRMVKGLKDNTDEGNKAIAALGQLGIKARDQNGHWRDMGQVLIEIAQRMDRFRTDADRVAFVQDALGKGAERYIPLLKDMAQGTDLHATVTAKQAAQAEEAEKNINRLKVAMEDARKETVNQFTPAIIGFTEKLLAANTAMGGFWQGLNQIMTVSGDQAADPMGSLVAVETRLKNLKELKEVLGGKSLGAMANRFFAPEDLAMVNKQIAYATAQQKILQELSKRQMERGGKDPNSPLFEFEGGGVTAQQDYQSVDQRRLKPSEILKMQQQGQEDFNQFVVRSNVEMNKVLDEQQKKNLIDHTANLMAAYDREQELAVENAESTGAADGESHSLQLVRLNEYLVGAASLENAAYEQRLQFLEAFSDATLEQYGGRLALIEAMYGEHNARLMEMDRNRNQQARSMEMQTWSLAGNFIQLFAAKSKVAAFAVIALNKALAIAQVIVNTQVAIMRGYAELGPYAGSAMAAYLTGLEAVQIGIIAATGLVEASRVGGGGGSAPSLGGPSAQPVFSADPVSGAPAAPQQKTIIVKIIGEGERFTIDQVRQLAEVIADNSEGGVVIS